MKHQGDAQEHRSEVQRGVPYPPRKAAPRRKQADGDAEHDERHAAEGEEGRSPLIEGLKSVHTWGLSHTVASSRTPAILPPAPQD